MRRGLFASASFTTAEAQASLMDITPESGEEAQKIAASIVETPTGTVARAKALLESK